MTGPASARQSDESKPADQPVLPRKSNLHPVLVWFRLDLRLADNPALAAAVESGKPVIAVYIHDPASEGSWVAGGASRWWLHQALLDLAAQLKKVGSRLVIRSGESLPELRRLIEASGADQVIWNRRYEPLMERRDTVIKAALREAGVTAESHNGNLLHDPLRIRNSTGQPFQVFTPFWKYCCSQPEIGAPLRAPEVLLPPARYPTSLPLEALQLQPNLNWHKTIERCWEPTRAGAMKRLDGFVTGSLSAYAERRDHPDADGTSRLSPYLHFGQISPREIHHSVQTSPRAGTSSADKFFAEVGWREFAHHLLHHFPGTPERPLRPEFEKFSWVEDPRLLRAWQKGQTGYPLVDAGMRQLWQTGWQHNRVRMIAASVLVKHFLQPWQAGAEWFWDTLVDADLASNTLGWQWVAGCGADAAPYFRIFNPVLQGEKFDPDGHYVRKFVPELAKLPAKWIHRPWEAPDNVLLAAGVVLDQTYPRPLIGLAEGRGRALAAFGQLQAER